MNWVNEKWTQWMNGIKAKAIQANNDGGLNKLNSEDWMKFSLIQEWMKWITN